MRTTFPLALILTLLAAGCRAPGDYPSLSPRAAEAIDPRLPVADTPSPGIVDPGLAGTLASAVAEARGGRGEFARLAAIAERLAAAAGPRQSESWVAAQEALSRLSAQHGVTTNAAARVDALAADRIEGQRWLAPAAQAAVAAAAAEVAAINDAQTATIARLSARLGV